MRSRSSIPCALYLILLLFGCGAERQEPSPGSMAEPPPEAVPQPDARPDATADHNRALMTFAQEGQMEEQFIGAVMQDLGERLLDRPYMVGPLDGFEEETLVVRLDSFDCFTFIEAVLAMARGVRAGDYSFDGYKDRTREQRYRGGQMRGYCSRMHYFTEWIADNEARGIVRDITQEVGGEPLPKRFGFMTAHREEYPQLARSDSAFACIQEIEARLNRRLKIYYIPEHRIREAYRELRAGDIVAAATDIAGLDVTHTGLVYKGEDGSTGLLHASTDGGVKISPDLQNYVEGIEAQIGIVVARPISR